MRRYIAAEVVAAVPLTFFLMTDDTTISTRWAGGYGHFRNRNHASRPRSRSAYLEILFAEVIDRNQSVILHGRYGVTDSGGNMNRVKTLIRQAERDVAVICAVEEALASIRLLNSLGAVPDLRAEIELLSGALILLGHSGE
jgi:hypothetical protein